MSPYYSHPYGPPTGSGYTCPTCGSWVPYGTVHYCRSYQPPATKWDRMSDVRIADALERIAAALEQIAKDAE